ncbi:MAG: double-strand break repair helicase AddA [Pseudomonadota bacterium]
MADSDYSGAVSAQATAADPNHSAWVSANAGSGKTKVLIDRVARLLLKGASPDSILCVTYTKAAANEMLQRLFDRLGNWSVMDEGDLRDELVALEGRENAPHTAEEIRQARALFARAVETPGGLRIETIHAFCSRILRRFPIEARMTPGFDEIDEIEAGALWDEAARVGILRAEADSPDMLDRVSRAGGAFGAMSGISAIRSHPEKIRAAISLYGDEFEKKLQDAMDAPEQDEASLLKRAMLDELPVADLRQAIVSLEADGASDAARTANAIRAVLSTPDPEERWSAYSGAFFTGTGKLRSRIYNATSKKDPLIPALFDPKGLPQGSEVLRVLELDRQLKARRLFERTAALMKLAEPILREFQKLKRQRAAVDFDDLIAFTRDLLTRSAAAEWVLYKLDGGLNHVLLDEAQDTSPDQWELLNALIVEFFSGEGVEKKQDPRTLFVVGDEKQSIYSFQGADPQRFMEERQQLDAKSRAALKPAMFPDMAMSFRSCPEILQFVDQVSQSGDVEGSPYIDGPVADFDIMRHTAFRQNHSGCVELLPVDVPDPLEDDVPWDAPLDTQSGSTPKSLLAKKVARTLSEIVARGDLVWDGKLRRPATPGDILILVENRGGGLFDGLIAALKAEGLPVAGADRLVLADHIGVQDCLNLMRFALLADDDLTLAEILRGPFAGLVDDNEHLFHLAHDRGDATLWDRLQASDIPAHRRVADFLSDVLSNRHLPPFEFLTQILECADREGETGWQKLIRRLGRPVIDPVMALIKKAMAHDARGPASMQVFIAAMDLDRSQIKRDLAAPNGEVRVMTVHGAKGLQAPIVVLPDMTHEQKLKGTSVLEIGGLPVWVGTASEDTDRAAAARDAAKARQMREHRRLLYVALTRAEDRLILAGHWTGQRPKPDTDPRPGYPDNSWYALCAEAMEALTGQSVADRETIRFGSAPEFAPEKTYSADTETKTPDWLFRNVPVETKPGRVVAASALLTDRTPVLPPSEGERAARLKRGRLIHALLERLPEHPMEDRRQRGAAFLACDLTLDDAQRDEMLDAALGVLDDKRFAEVFALGGRAEAPIIGTSEALPEGLVINGRVDRLIVTPEKVMIVDFKTDRPPPADVSGVSSSYLAQMAAYRTVLQSAYPGRDVEAALLWTDGPVLMPLTADLLEESLSPSNFAV